MRHQALERICRKLTNNPFSLMMIFMSFVSHSNWLVVALVIRNSNLLSHKLYMWENSSCHCRCCWWDSTHDLFNHTNCLFFLLSLYHFQVSVYHALNYKRKWPEMWIFTTTTRVILLSGNSSSCSSSTQNADKYSWMNEWMKSEVSKLNREWGRKEY